MTTHEGGLPAGDVARMLGVAVTTLRTWDTRYGIGPRRHRPGQHRRYQADDIERLAHMSRLTSQGVPAAEAAAWILRQGVVARRDGGAHTIAVDRAGPAARGLARAAMRLDGWQVRAELASAIAEHGVVATWTSIVMPVLVLIGRKHAATGSFIEVEHLLSQSVSAALAALPRPGTPAAVLLACADEEQHSLPLEALAAALAERGTAARMLGARVPPGALHEAIRRTGPEVVVLWSHEARTGDPAQVVSVGGARPRPKLIVAAGPGWPLDRLPDGTATPTTLGAAVDLVRYGRYVTAD